VIPSKAFYIDPENMDASNFQLDMDESRHAVQVLRLEINDEICLLNGIGTGFIGVVRSINNDLVSGLIKKELKGLGENIINIVLAPAIIKRDRFENLIEKATEIGINMIQPLALDRCVKKTINIERCEKIIRSSAKQCLRSKFPKVNSPVNMQNFIDNLFGQTLAGMMDSSKSLSKIDFNKGEPINVIIGPEGDFSNRELNMMKDVGVHFYSLGSRRLRSETASLTSISILNEILN
jgi:16S rRNA (uracil1498-N3)-methyltransferase|tara:strand:- start:3266 stop:3973 length:708 start_codon:yes stop_codon:yes gene_type:complete